MIVFEIVGRTRIAEKTGLGRDSLYKVLSAEGNPEFATVLKVMQALDFRLVVSPIRSQSGGDIAI